MEKRRAFLFDSGKCIGCFSCSMACKQYNRLEPSMVWRHVYPLDENIYPHRERAFYSLACNHCENPACLEACPTNSYSKRPDGVVEHHEATCIGCHNCIRSCPYGVPQYNEAERHAEKCSFCHERLDAGLLPACVQGCPTGALTMVDLNELEEPRAVQYPDGYPQLPALNPSTRFILPRMPRQVRG